MAEYLNLQVARSGFGSYLTNIVPEDIAITSGAFSAAMQQIRNITTIPIEKFAQIVNSMETTKGLNSVNGTNVPVDTTLANEGLNLTALGTGPYGTYTFSDFFGCMSGLPYHWQDIYKGIQDLSTPTLENIYKQLYLAVIWNNSAGTVQYTTRAEESPPLSGNYNYYYTITGVTLTTEGKGYSRGEAPTPTAQIVGTTSGGTIPTVTVVIDTNSTNVPGTFGCVTNLILGATSEQPNGSGGSPTPPDPGFTLRIQSPPTAYGYTGLTNTAYTVTNASAWSATMSSIVQSYIDDSNTEIQNIFNSKPNVAKALNINYDMAGTQLTIEQRTRYNAIPPVPTPRDRFVNLYPTSQEVFVDTLPVMAQDTSPHGAAQTMEAITDVCNPGAQSIIGLMRESRNALRLQELGIDQDNNIPDTLDPSLASVLLANGSIPGARNGIDVPNSQQKFTNPSNLGVSDCSVDAKAVLPETFGFLDPATNILRITNANFNGQGGTTTDNTVLGTILNAVLYGQPLGPAQAVLTGPVQPAGPGVPSQDGSPAVYTAGGSIVKSFSGSPYSNLLPPNLNSPLVSGTLTPSIYSVQEAIDEVIRCNCDCWVQ